MGGLDLKTLLGLLQMFSLALTPSVTMMVVQFVLDDDAATAFDRLSRETDFKPRTRIHENGISPERGEGVDPAQAAQAGDGARPGRFRDELGEGVLSLTE